MRIPFSVSQDGSMFVSRKDRLAFLDYFNQILASGHQPHVGIDEVTNEIFIR